MDKLAWTVVGFIIVAVAFLLITRRRGGKQKTNIKLKAPGVSLDASTEASPDAGVVVEDATSKTGGLTAEDKSGRGIRATRIETQQDIVLVNSAPPVAEAPKS